MLNDVRESEGNRREWIVEVLKDIDGMHTGYLHKGELVRCKECRHWCSHKDVDYDQSKFTYYCEVHGISFEGDDYCSFGERKEGE